MATVSPTKKLMKTPGSAPATKTVTKAAPAKTATAKAADAVAEPETKEAPDVIAQTAKVIENLNADKAFKLVPELVDAIERDGFKLGGVLAKVQSEGWYQEQGHENFKAWVEASAGIAYRKAMYLISIYNSLVEAGIPYEKVANVGWSKLKELAPILSVENVDEWVTLAMEMTVLQLQEHIKKSLAGTAEGGAPEGDTSEAKKVVTKTFKLHADQKQTVDDALAKAKNAGNTESDAVALEYICMDYLAGDKGTAKPKSLKEVLKGKSMEEALEAMGEAYPTLVLQASLYETAEEAEAAKAEIEAAAAEEEGTEEGTEEAAES